jgi:DNA-binding MarR family transcriptional regulator
MATLTSLHPEVRVAVPDVRETFGVTDGNLGAHLRKLEDAGYIEVTKEFVQRKPRTFIRATDVGRARFQRHINMLRDLIDGIDGQS